ncbi:hypothetical protein C0Q70_10468 [Pomacea canaliculata]|uniref:MD-2-related lipid-recognition domain-containing protein n=1 Tax=Pomacea canaliculata TaxID=400727 RepID=A0A2T7P3C1_POMCA|nr:hypothetical protein C0Q70_10468 [Pomacea canaliculata]
MEAVACTDDPRPQLLEGNNEQSDITSPQPSYGQRSRDADSWIKLTKFDMSPTPLHLPGNALLTVNGAVSHVISENVEMDVTILKHLLSRWTKMPCTEDLGSCHYDDPCHFMQVFFPNGTCPKEFTDNGMPCTCPFKTSNSITLNQDRLSLPDGDYYIKIVMTEKGNQKVVSCLEFYVSLSRD